MKSKLVLLIIATAAAAMSCSGIGHGQTDAEFAEAERLIASKPDSALAILHRMDVKPQKKRDYATWCLLKTWAEYNAYTPDISGQQLNTGVEYFMKHRPRERRALAYYLRAVVPEDGGTSGKAKMADDLKRGCKEVDGTGNHYLASLLYMRYGGEMNERKWYDKGVEALDKALEEAEKGDLKILQVTILINLAHAYMFLGDKARDYTEALAEADKAAEIAKNAHLGTCQLKALNAKALCCSRAGMFEEALDCALKADKIAGRLEAEGKLKERVTHIALADAYRKLDNADSAIFYALKDTSSTSIVTRAGAVQLLYMVYRDILKDNDMAIRYLTEYNALKNTMAERQENGLVVKNEVELEQDIADEKRSRIMLAASAAIVMALSALAGIVLIHRRRMRKKDSTIAEQSEELEKQAQELDIKVHELEEKSGEILQTREELHN